MYWLIILTVLAVTFRKEIFSFLEKKLSNREKYVNFVNEKVNKYGKNAPVIIVFSLLIFSVGCCLISHSNNQEKSDEVAIEKTMISKPSKKNNIISIDGNDIMSIKVKDVDFVCRDCGFRCNSNKCNDNKNHSIDRVVLVFNNGRKLTYWSNDDEFIKWVDVRDGDICSYVRKVDETGRLIDEFYFPVSPEFICYNEQADSLYYKR